MSLVEEWSSKSDRRNLQEVSPKFWQDIEHLSELRLGRCRFMAKSEFTDGMTKLAPLASWKCTTFCCWCEHLDHLDPSFDIGKVVSHFLNRCIWSSKLLWSFFEHFYQARTRRRLSSLDVARRVWTRRSWNEGGSWRPGTTCPVSAAQGLNMRDSGCDVSYALRKDRLLRS